MRDYTHRLTLEAWHDSADLSEIPVRFGLTAKTVARVGDPRIAPNGRVTGTKYRFSICAFEFDPPGDQTLPENIVSVMTRLKSHSDYFLELFAAGVQFKFFVGWFSGSMSRDWFDWRLLADLAELKISLDLNFYGPDEAEPMDSKAGYE